MSYREIWKDFFKKTVLPVVIALCLFLMFKNVFTENGQTNYLYIWLCAVSRSVFAVCLCGLCRMDTI